MATDFDGNSLANGDKVWIPATVTNASNASLIVVQPAYGGGTIQIIPAAVRKPRAFPDAP